MSLQRSNDRFRCVQAAHLAALAQRLAQFQLLFANTKQLAEVALIFIKPDCTALATIRTASRMIGAIG